MTRTRCFAVLSAILVAACSGGGSSGGSSRGLGPVDWGVPFVPSGFDRSLSVVLHNLERDGAVATVTQFQADGTLDGAPILVTLDGEDEHVVPIASNTGGMLLVSTPSRHVEVAFDVDASGENAEETSRAWPLGDLAFPPPLTVAPATITLETIEIHLCNASAAPALVSVTAFREPLSPADPVIEIVGTPVALAAHETRILDATAITGVASFRGSIRFESANMIFAGTVEGPLGFEGVPQFQPKDRTVAGILHWGLDSTTPNGYTDFALVLRNDSALARDVTIDHIRRGDGVELTTPRTVSVSAHTTRTLTTQEFPFDDIFGDVTHFASLTHPAIELSVPAEVSATFRQFDPQLLRHLMTVHPSPLGHVFEVLDVEPVPLLPSLRRTFVSIHNPNSLSITVNPTVLIPQPPGFDAGFVQLSPIVVAPGATFIVSLDGNEFFDRDGFPRDTVSLRLFSAAPFYVAGRKEIRDGFDLLQVVTPRVAREVDDAE